MLRRRIDMKNMCPKRRAKIHTSSSPPSSSSHLSALHLLPPAVLTIVSLLSLSDREVLAYLILRSLQNPTALKPKTPSKKCETLVFDCGCFDCYTSFWIRWDSSPNRDLIHQAIETFEDYISDLSACTHRANPRRTLRQQSETNPASRGECSKQTKKGNYKKGCVSARGTEAESVAADDEQEISEVSCNGQPTPAAAAVACEEEEENVEGGVSRKRSVPRSAAAGYNRGLVRKVWPDVLGLCNSRLWSLWSPNS